jgi:hypothetical protein
MRPPELMTHETWKTTPRCPLVGERRTGEWAPGSVDCSVYKINFSPRVRVVREAAARCSSVDYVPRRRGSEAYAWPADAAAVGSASYKHNTAAGPMLETMLRKRSA